ncbi:zinc ABC transporter ATP-binding protein ZnuC [Leucothrix arctica]|uniref:Zinc ABC transporter ATP-binding protein ZnuC n=1 Tax=Leucothrix arctica TaxID=1481894 RepID=A0A317CF62_9GAMM|nr:zinc ABC transporter ATP-binding protein ZnuC [Leucothrix arctica]PWQ94792.1 zinc ABC transporter ATP-binding protein ZnuC [Leucothrix arctica]
MKDSDKILATLKHVSLALEKRQILQDISITLEAGKVLTIIGPNGAGKSTLLRILLGLQKPDAGEVTRKPGLRIGYVPQSISIESTLPLTVARFVALGGKGNVKEVLAELRIAHLAKSAIQSISGGEFQRVLLARAIMRKPDLLVLDEPAQGVDVMGQGELYDRISTLRQRYGFGVIMVSHDLHLVMEKTDQVICLNQHICCHGVPDDVSRHPEYKRLFGDMPDSGLAVYTHNHDHAHDLQGNVVHSKDCDHG